MKRISLLGAFCALLVASAAGRQGQETPPLPTSPSWEARSGMHYSGRLIARPLQPSHTATYGLSAAEVQAHRAAARSKLEAYPLIKYVEATDETIVAVERGAERAVARALMADGDFQYVEPDWLLEPTVCPDDPRLNQQWHHDANRMNSCAGWDIESGDPSIVVAICDSGVQTLHEDLQLHRQEGYHSPTGLWESQGGQVQDINGHGTSTTGCAAANGDNGVGISGTGWNLGHRMMRVTDLADGSAFVSDIESGARAAADVGDKVVSVSYEGAGAASIETTGAYCRNKGALLLWAAGNGGGQINGNRDDNVLYVGSTTSSDGKSSFSNYGPLIDLMAPGSSIHTLHFAAPNTYTTTSGTSFSCPLTAGLAGLVFSVDPDLSPAEVETLIRAGCDDKGAPGVDNLFGYGRINVHTTLALMDDGVSRYCSPSALGTVLDVDSTSLSGPILFTVTNASPNKSGYLLVGQGDGVVTDPPGSTGDLCLQGFTIGRYAKDIAMTDGAGTMSIDVVNGIVGGGNANLPPALGGQIDPGETWNFQMWTRHNMSTSTFTDALSVTFTN